MRRRSLLIGCVAMAAVMVGTAGLAQALWSDHGSVTPAAMLKGKVMFSVEEQGNSDSRQFSTGDGQADGSTVSVTLPGSVIAEVLGGDTVIWRFDVIGRAAGMAGMDYDIAYDLPDDNTPTVINTVLEGTRVRVYPATGDNDCSNSPGGRQPRRGLATISDQVLQEPGENQDPAALHNVKQTWCVALAWDSDPSRYHTNAATVSATAEDGRLVTSTDVFDSYIDYQPTLDASGSHTNTAHVQATGENGAVVDAEDSWLTVIFPDPAAEPPLVFDLTPHVTIPQAPAEPN